jgi:hypothetical protein
MCPHKTRLRARSRFGVTHFDPTSTNGQDVTFFICHSLTSDSSTHLAAMSQVDLPCTASRLISSRVFIVTQIQPPIPMFHQAVSPAMLSTFSQGRLAITVQRLRNTGRGDR